MGDFQEYSEFDGVGLAQLVRGEQVSAIDVVDAAIARIEALNPQLNAVIDRLDDEARSRAAARSRWARWQVCRCC